MGQGRHRCAEIHEGGRARLSACSAACAVAFDLLAEHKDTRLDLATIPAEDPAHLRDDPQGRHVGVFQIESRAQMAMLPRIKPRTFYDLVIEVAIVRPGPIQGDMVHPYLRRREGIEPVDYPKPELERVLGKTLGVPLFQEQAMRVAIECAGFTPSEADQLRRSMATFKHTGGVSKFRDKLVNGMVARGYTQEFAEKTFSQLEGFGSYGFPESHAASFALIAYASSWMKCWHPDVFLAAILNAQPMGFYAPAQLVRDARQHRVDVRPIDVNASRWDCTLEPVAGTDRHAVRLGLRLARGLANKDGAAIVTARGRYALRERRRSLAPRGRPGRRTGAPGRCGRVPARTRLARREAVWAIRALRDEPLPLFAAAAARAAAPIAEVTEPAVALRPMTAGREVVEDYSSVGLTLRRHPVAFLRSDLAAQGVVCCADAMGARDGRWLRTAGIILVRQRPGSASGVIFVTIEDETAVANLVIWPKVFEKQRRIVLGAGMLAVKGRVQREGEVVHIIAHELTDLSALLRSVGDRDAPFMVPHGRGDQVTHGGGPDPRETLGRKPRDIYIPDLRGGPEIKVPTRDFR